MLYTLVVYDRAAGSLVSQHTFDSRASALRARFDAEAVYRGQETNIEVVVLAARSHDELLSTHSRYFRSLSELAEQAI